MSNPGRWNGPSVAKELNGKNEQTSQTDFTAAHDGQVQQSEREVQQSEETENSALILEPPDSLRFSEIRAQAEQRSLARMMEFSR